MKQLTIYKNANYSGASLQLTANRSRLPVSLLRTVSSARVAHPVAMFTGSRYTGDVVVLTSDASRFSSIRRRNLNNRIQSIRYEPLRLRLNITVGTDASGAISKSMESVADQVATANDLWAPFGIEFEPAEIRTIEGLHQPMTALRQDALIAPHLSSDAVNILFFGGTHWTNFGWRWRVNSIDLTSAPDSTETPSVEIFTEPNYGGTRTLVNRDLTSLTDDQLPVRSMKLGAGTRAAVFSKSDKRGNRLDVFHHVPSFDDLHFVRNWWGNKIGHCCHGPGSLIRNDNRSGSLTLAHELGHWMGLGHDTSPSNLMFPSASGGREITFAQAERVWKSVLRSATKKAVLV